MSEPAFTESLRIILTYMFAEVSKKIILPSERAKMTAVSLFLAL